MTAPSAAEVAPGQQPLGLAHPGALGDDVTGPPAQHGIGQLAQVAERAQAEGPAEDVRGPLALGPPVAYGVSVEEAGRLAVHDDEGRLVGDGHLVGLERVEVDVERVARGRRRRWPADRAGRRGRRRRARPPGRSRASASGSASWPSASRSATEKAALEERPAPTGSVLVTRTAPPLGGWLQPQEPGRQGGLGGAPAAVPPSRRSRAARPGNWSESIPTRKLPGFGVKVTSVARSMAIGSESPPL